MFFNLSQNYFTRGFWGDEAWTSLISQLPYAQMLKTTAADFHPPGYYTIVELTYQFLPPTETATRVISIIFYLLTILLVYQLASIIKRGLFGWFSAVVVASNPIFFAYAFEARNYTMFALAATGSVYALIRLSVVFQPLTKTTTISKGLKNDWLGWWLLFVIFATLGIYTHYYMFFVLIAQLLYLTFFDRKILLKIIGALGVIGLLYLPWIPFLLSQVISVGQNYWIGHIDQKTHFETLLRILAGEHENILRPALFWFSLTLLTIGLIQHWRQKFFEKPYILIWLWFLVPFILATFPGLKIAGFKLPFRPIFFWRYFIGAAVPLSMVIVHAAQKLPNAAFKISIVLVITLSIVIDFLTFRRQPVTFKEIFEKEIVPQIKTADKIVTVLPSFAEVLYYRNQNSLTNEVVVLPEGLVQFSGKSLLDAYVAKGVVKIANYPSGPYFELRPGFFIKKAE